MNKILLFIAAVAVINTALFFSQPSPPFVFNASDISPANLLFYQFSHFDVMHLMENLLGLIFTAALAIELGIKTEDFVAAYFVGVFIAVPLLFMFPGSAIAGNSTGIFGALAITLIRARKFIPVYISYTFATLFIFSVSLMSAVSGGLSTTALKSDIFHFFGFMAGAAVSFSKRRHRIFSGALK